MKFKKLFVLPAIMLLASCGNQPQNQQPNQPEGNENAIAFQNAGKELINKAVDIYQDSMSISPLRGMVTPPTETQDQKMAVMMAYMNPGNFFYMVSHLTPVVDSLQIDASSRLLTFGFTYNQSGQNNMQTELDILFQCDKENGKLYFSGYQKQKLPETDWNGGYCVVEADFDFTNQKVNSFTYLGTMSDGQVMPDYYEYNNGELLKHDGSTDEKQTDILNKYSSIKSQFASLRENNFQPTKGAQNKLFVDAYVNTQAYVDSLMGGDTGFELVDY